MTRNIQHPRIYIGAGHQSGQSASTYLRPAGRPDYSADLGNPMLRNGSLTGFGSCLDVTAASGTTTFEFEVRKNVTETVLFTSTQFNVTTTGSKVNTELQERGIVTFSAGDYLQVFLTIGGAGTVTALVYAFVELEFV